MAPPLWSEVSWDRFPGPHDPEEIPRAFEKLLAVRDESTSHEAYSRMLFAVGNNHAGSLFPVAAAAVYEVVRVALAGTGWVRHCALQILIELVLFEPEEGLETFTTLDGRVVDVAGEIRGCAKANHELIFNVLQDQEESPRNRAGALDLLDSTGYEPSKLAAAIASIMGASPPPELRKACEDVTRNLAEDSRCRRV